MLILSLYLWQGVGRAGEERDVYEIKISSHMVSMKSLVCLGLQTHGKSLFSFLLLIEKVFLEQEITEVFWS